MVQMNLFPGKEQRLRHKEWTCDMGRAEKRAGQIERVGLYVFTLLG